MVVTVALSSALSLAASSADSAVPCVPSAHTGLAGWCPARRRSCRFLQEPWPRRGRRSRRVHRSTRRPALTLNVGSAPSCDSTAVMVGSSSGVVKVTSALVVLPALSETGEGDGVLARRQIDRGCRIRQFDRVRPRIARWQGLRPNEPSAIPEVISEASASMVIVPRLTSLPEFSSSAMSGVMTGLVLSDRDRGLGAVRTELRGYRMLAVGHRGGVPQILVGGHGGFGNSNSSRMYSYWPEESPILIELAGFATSSVTSSSVTLPAVPGLTPAVALLACSVVPSGSTRRMLDAW